jgi:hypothetical protein
VTGWAAVPPDWPTPLPVSGCARTAPVRRADAAGASLAAAAAWLSSGGLMAAGTGTILCSAADASGGTGVVRTGSSGGAADHSPATIATMQSNTVAPPPAAA